MKFRLTKFTKKYYGKTLHRIQAIKDFGNIEKGDMGGFVEYENNLSQYDNCWIFDKAMVMGNSSI